MNKKTTAALSLIGLVLAVLFGLALLGCSPLDGAQKSMASTLFTTTVDPVTGELIVDTDNPTMIGKAVHDGLSTLDIIFGAAFGVTGSGAGIWALLKMLSSIKSSKPGQFFGKKEEGPPPSGSATPASA